MNLVARIVPSTVWIVHTAMFSFMFKSTAHIFVCALVATCFAMVPELLNCLSTGVCNHHCLPCLTREGLPISPSSGNCRPVMRTLIQLQHVPVHTLITMLLFARSFHIPA